MGPWWAPQSTQNQPSNVQGAFTRGWNFSCYLTDNRGPTGLWGRAFSSRQHNPRRGIEVMKSKWDQRECSWLRVSAVKQMEEIIQQGGHRIVCGSSLKVRVWLLDWAGGSELFLKGQTVNILGSVTTTQLRHCSAKAAIHSMYVNERGHVPEKLYLQNQSPSSSLPNLNYSIKRKDTVGP